MQQLLDRLRRRRRVLDAEALGERLLHRPDSHGAVATAGDGACLGIEISDLSPLISPGIDVRDPWRKAKQFAALIAAALKPILSLEARLRNGSSWVVPKALPLFLCAAGVLIQRELESSRERFGNQSSFQPVLGRSIDTRRHEVPVASSLLDFFT